MRTSCIIMLVIGQLALSCAPRAAFGAPNAFDQAVQEYKAGDYGKASADLLALVQQHPNDANAHYMLGCCLTQLDQYDNAKDEYTSAIRCDKTGQVRPLATQAINRLAAYNQNIAQQAQQAPVDTAADSLRTIQAQVDAASEQERANRAGWIDARERTTLGEHARRYANKPGYSENTVQDVLQKDKDYWDGVRTQSLGRPSSAALNASVGGLVQQMRGDGNVKLIPGLTNLYLRTYEISPSSASNPQSQKQKTLPEQLCADQDRLILQPVKDKLVTHVAPAQLAASQNKLILHSHGDKSRSQLTVSGRLTHK